MNTIYRTLSLAATAALLSLGFGAATAGCDSVDRVTDCHDICARYSDCYNASYDVSACRTRCDDSGADSAAFDQKIDECENCLDDRSCTSATFNCATECAGIVP